MHEQSNAFVIKKQCLSMKRHKYVHLSFVWSKIPHFFAQIKLPVSLRSFDFRQKGIKGIRRTKISRFALKFRVDWQTASKKKNIIYMFLWSQIRQNFHYAAHVGQSMSTCNNRMQITMWNSKEWQYKYHTFIASRKSFLSVRRLAYYLIQA